MTSGRHIRRSSGQNFFLLYAICSAVVGQILFVTLTLIATTLWPEFDWYRRTLSNLASPVRHFSAPIMTVAFVLPVALALPLIVYTLRYCVHRASLTSRASIYVLPISFVTMVLLAIFTDLRPTLFWHRLFAGISILCVGLHLVLSSISYVRRKDTRALGYINGGVFLIVVLAWLLKDSFGWNDAIPEFLSVLASANVAGVLSARLWYYGPLN